jgi:Zn-dependent peptidase ImmA (M78 family)
MDMQTPDRRREIITVSTRFPYPTQRFTGAHEIGHFVMHPHEVMHRDRPVFDTGGARPPKEQATDYFAACFLGPKKLVEEEFAARFVKTPPLLLDDTVAWNLLGESAHELFGVCAGSLDYTAAVAGARSFNGWPFTCLAEHFGLSISAIAIRLLELKLLAD